MGFYRLIKVSSQENEAYLVLRAYGRPLRHNSLVDDQEVVEVIGVEAEHEDGEVDDQENDVDPAGTGSAPK